MNQTQQGRQLTFNPQMNKIISEWSKIYAWDQDDAFYALNQLNNIITYFAGEFDELTGNKSFKRIKLDFWECAFYSNEVYLYGNAESDKMTVLSKISDNKFQKWNSNETFSVNEDKLAHFRLPIFNAFLQWFQLFSEEKDLFNIWRINALFDAKKILMFVNSTDPEQIEEMEREFFNSKKAFIYQRTLLNDGNDSIPNTIEPIPHTGSNTAITFDNIIDHFNLYADRLGYAIAQEFKKERLTSGENLLNAHNTNNICRMILNELEVLSDDLKEKFNITLTFDKQYDLEVEPESEVLSEPEQDQGKEQENE